MRSNNTFVFGYAPNPLAQHMGKRIHTAFSNHVAERSEVNHELIDPGTLGPFVTKSQTYKSSVVPFLAKAIRETLSNEELADTMHTKAVEAEEVHARWHPKTKESS